MARRRLTFDLFRPPAFHFASEERDRAQGQPSGGDDHRAKSTATVATLAAEDARHATFAELFYDLVFFLPLHRLGLRSTNADDAADYIFYFAAIFNAWVGEAFWHTRFDNDDTLVHIFTLLCIVGVYGMAAGVVRDGSNIFSGSYALVRLLLILKYARTASHLPAARSVCLKFIACFSFGVCFWVASCFVDDSAAKWTLLLLGISVDYASPFLLLRSLPPIHKSHMPERCSLWVVMISSVFVLDFLDDALGADVMDERSGGEDIRAHFLSCARVVGAISIPFSFLMLYSFKARYNLTSSALDSFVYEGLGGKLRIYALIYWHMVLTAAFGLSAMAVNSYMSTCPLDGQEAWGSKLRKRCGYDIPSNQTQHDEPHASPAPPGRFLIYAVAATYFAMGIYHWLCSAANGDERPVKRIATRAISSALLFVFGAIFEPNRFACSDVLIAVGTIGALNVIGDRIEIDGVGTDDSQMRLLA